MSRQRIEIRQPSDAVLKWLAEHSEAYINQLEMALDCVFRHRADRDETGSCLHRHLVRRWHGAKQDIRIVPGKLTPSAADGDLNGTRYDVGRWAPNLTALYTEEFSRYKGELHCLHVEWRLNGRKAVCGGGIISGADMFEFDHRQSWKKRQLLLAVDKGRLSRLFYNQRQGVKARKTTNAMRHDRQFIDDQRRVEFFVRTRATIQELIDDLGPSCRIHRALVQISSELLLPE